MPHLIRSVFSRMQTYSEDRRHPPRFRVRLVFTVSLCRKAQGKGLRPERALKGYTRDLSPSGLALRLPQVHLDGLYLADEDREVKVKLELPTGPISMRVSPKRYEKLDQAELNCKYLIGVQITDISEEDRERYLSFISPENRQNVPALQKQIVPENVRSAPSVQREIAPEPEVTYSHSGQEAARDGKYSATWWRGLDWKPIYQITEISNEERRRYLSLVAPEAVRSLPALQKGIGLENERRLPAIQEQPATREVVRSLSSVQEEVAPKLEGAYAPLRQDPTRRRLSWKPIYAAIIVIGITLVVGAAILSKRRAGRLGAKEAQTSSSLNRDGQPANDLSLPATPNESPVENQDRPGDVIALNDRSGTVTVDNSGNVLGLDDVPASTRDDIARALLSERIARPAVLKNLAGQESAVGGNENAQPFRLIFPSRAAIATDRPALKWERISGASSYRVYVKDFAGREMARSEDLPSERTEWLLPKPLKRGEIYAWTVVAIVDGKEIASPGASAKFQVLSEGNLQQLSQVKRTGSKLALGVFYSRQGMIPGAEREFQALVRENPNSAAAKKLLAGVQSWHKPVAANSSDAKKQSVARAGLKEVTVQVTYDEYGRVTQASGADASALRIARQKRFPAGKAGSATITIPIN